VYTIYLVPHTHYDAVWALSKEDYLYINIDIIMKQALDLTEKMPRCPRYIKNRVINILPFAAGQIGINRLNSGGRD